MNSVIFFPLFLLICSQYAYIGNKYGKYRKNILISILVIIYTFVLGVRVNFGTDQVNYLRMYFYQGIDLLRCEKIFVLLNQILRYYNAPYQILFSIIAFLEIYLLIWVFEKEKVNIFYGFILFFLIYINLNLNLSRQAIAMGLILLSITLFAEKKYISWISVVGIASGFHIASLLVLFALPILKFVGRFKIPKFIYYILLFLSSMFFEQMFDITLKYFLIPLNLFLGDKTTIIEKLLSLEIPLGTGMGVRLRGFAYMLMLPLIFHYKNQCDKNNFYFSIFFFGVLGEFIASTNMNFARIFYYFSQVQLIVIPQVISDIKISNLRRLRLKNVSFLLGLFFILLLAIPKWISGSDNTSFYTISLDFNLINNHTF